MPLLSLNSCCLLQALFLVAPIVGPPGSAPGIPTSGLCLPFIARSVAGLLLRPSPLMAGCDSSQLHKTDEQITIFSSLISENGATRIKPTTTKFVKKLTNILEISLPPSIPWKAAISLVERGLVGQFTGLWPSPKAVQKWVERN